MAPIGGVLSRYLSHAVFSLGGGDLLSSTVLDRCVLHFYSLLFFLFLFEEAVPLPLPEVFRWHEIVLSMVISVFSCA